MATYKGYNLKATKTGSIFPEKYIQEGTWSANPKQIEYLKFFRDDNTRDVTKIAAQGRKSTIQFSTLKGLNLKARQEIEKFFADNQINADGDISLEYWDDKSMVYREGSFYRPNMEFKQISHSDKDVFYDSLTFKFVEN